MFSGDDTDCSAPDGYDIKGEKEKWKSENIEKKKRVPTATYSDEDVPKGEIVTGDISNNEEEE